LCSAWVLLTVAACGQEIRYNSDGQLLRPVNYREWVFLTAGLDMTYGTPPASPNAAPRFDNVFVNPSSYRAFLESGKWPDKTIFVLEIRNSATNVSINKGGHVQNDLVAVEAAVKDEQRFPEKWAYFGFPALPGPIPATAKANPQGRCWACHNANGAVDNTFVQFYPTLIPVAQSKGTLKPKSTN